MEQISETQFGPHLGLNLQGLGMTMDPFCLVGLFHVISPREATI